MSTSRGLMKSQSHGNACSDKDLKGSWGTESRELNHTVFKVHLQQKNEYFLNVQ